MRRPWLGGFAALCVGLIVILLITVPQAEPVPPVVDDVAPAELIRLTGSTTVGEELVPALAREFLESRDAEVVTTVTKGSRTTTVTGTLPGQVGVTRFEIDAVGTAPGFDALRDGRADIAMASRRVDPAEVMAMEDLQVIVTRESEHVLGVDGVAVIVHRDLPVRELTVEQLRGVFSCQIENWSELGGPDLDIEVVARSGGSGTDTFFRNNILRGAALCPDATLLETGQEVAELVAADQPDAIGFVELPNAGNGDTVALTLSDPTVPTRPVAPTTESVSNRSYLLTRELFLYRATTSDNAAAQAFLDFADSEEGQRVVERVGFVRANPIVDDTTEPPPDPCAGPAPYCAFVNGAERVPFDVRFDPADDQLDNRSRRNLDLLASDVDGRQVLLVGFTDSQGPPEVNLDLSQRRADSARTYLEGLDPDPEATGFGADLPVASNGLPEGREANRRVEVWLR